MSVTKVILTNKSNIRQWNVQAYYACCVWGLMTPVKEMGYQQKIPVHSCTRKIKLTAGPEQKYTKNIRFQP